MLIFVTFIIRYPFFVWFLSATDKIALVIGNRDYGRLPLNESPLVHTCNDAKMLASMLRKPEMGFKVISLMNLTTDEMCQALGIFYSLLGEGVYGLVYFAGHGFEEGGQNYLVPVDAEGEWVPEKAVCAQKVLDEMNRWRTQLIVFLLDICRKRWVPIFWCTGNHNINFYSKWIEPSQESMSQ